MYKKELGKWGEEQSSQYLINKGYSLVARNYRCPIGEIDLIAFKDGALIFVEVKTRRSKVYGTPAEAVNYKKQNKYLKSALFFIAEKRWQQWSYRFDIIEVFVDKNDRIDINHIPNAYQPTNTKYYF